MCTKQSIGLCILYSCKMKWCELWQLYQRHHVSWSCRRQLHHRPQYLHQTSEPPALATGRPRMVMTDRRLTWGEFVTCYSVALCVNTVLAIGQCPSDICLSHLRIVSKQLKTASDFFLGPVALLFLFWVNMVLHNSKRKLLSWSKKNSYFLADISLYLGNGTR